MIQPGLYKISPSTKFSSDLTKNMNKGTVVFCDGQSFWYKGYEIPVHSLAIVVESRVEEPNE